MKEFVYTPMFSEDERAEIMQKLSEDLSGKVLATIDSVETEEKAYAKQCYEETNGIIKNNKYGFKTKHGKIIESTEQQLYAYWLDHWSEIYSFTDYLQKCKDAATKIIDK